MWPLSLPVYFHWLMNCGWARLAIFRMAYGGRRHRDQRDQGQLPGHDEHQRQHADDGEQRGDQLAEGLLHRLLQVVDVVGDPAQDLPARLPVEVGQRQPGQLGLHLLAQPEHRALDHRRGQPALEQRADGRAHVQRHDHEQDLPHVVEVDPAVRGVAEEHDVDRLAEQARAEHLAASRR